MWKFMMDRQMTDEECQVMAKANMVWASGVKLYLAEVIKKLNHLKIKSKRTSSLFLLVALHEQQRNNQMLPIIYITYCIQKIKPPILRSILNVFIFNWQNWRPPIDHSYTVWVWSVHFFKRKQRICKTQILMTFF